MTDSYPPFDLDKLFEGYSYNHLEKLFKDYSWNSPNDVLGASLFETERVQPQQALPQQVLPPPPLKVDGPREPPRLERRRKHRSRVSQGLPFVSRSDVARRRPRQANGRFKPLASKRERVRRVLFPKSD